MNKVETTEFAKKFLLLESGGAKAKRFIVIL